MASSKSYSAGGGSGGSGKKAGGSASAYNRKQAKANNATRAAMDSRYGGSKPTQKKNK